MVTVLTRTIGPSGRDYASFTLAEADVTNIGTSADLVANDEAIVFEADAGTYNEAVSFSSTLTTDATRNVTYKPAAGSEHGGIFGAGVVLHDSSASYGSSQTIFDSYTILDGLEVHVSNTGGFRTGLAIYLNHDVVGVKIRNMLLWSQTQRTPLAGPSVNPYDIGSSADPIVFENLLLKKTDNFADLCNVGCVSGQSGHYAITNCTFISDLALNYRAFAISAPGTLNVQVTNCMSLVPWQWYQSVTGTLNLTGSNNFGGSSLPFPAALQGSPYPITATTDTDPGAGDWAIYQASNGQLYHVPDNDVWGQGVGPTANSDVPTTDIVGAARSGSTANPGAFETGVPPSISTNQLVAPNGRLEADTISHIDQYTYVTLEKSGALTGGETVSYIWYYKVDSTLAAGAGETVTFSMKDLGGAVIEEINWAVAYDDATPTVALGSTTTAGSGYTVSALSYAAVSNDWVRCSITLTDHSSSGRDVVVTHTSMMGAASAGTIYGVTIWGSEVTTLDRTPTANDLRPVSGGIVDFDAYPPEHRSLFASYTDLGDNNYRVTTTLTDDGSTTDYVQIEHFQANSADTTHQIYLSNPTLEDPDLELQALLINPPLPTAAWFEIPLITHATHELGNDGRVPTMVNSTNYYASHLGWGSDEGAAEDEPSPYGGDKITVIVPPVRGTGFP